MKKFLSLAVALVSCTVMAAPVVLNSRFHRSAESGNPDNWGETFKFNGTLECTPGAIKVAAKDDSFLDEKTQFNVIPGGKLTLSVNRDGSGDVGFIVRVFDAENNQIHLEVMNGSLSADQKRATGRYTIRFDYKGKKAAKASVGLFFRGGADMKVAGFLCDYDAGTNIDIKPEDRTDWARGTYEMLTKKAASEKNIPIMFLGDSITQLWGFERDNKYPGGLDTWNAVFKPMGAENYGVSGDTIQNVLWRITAGKQLACMPRVIVLNIGTNNLHFEPVFSPKQVAGGVDILLKEIKRQSPKSSVLLIGILPRSGSHPIVAINDELKEVARKNKVTFMDVSKALLQGKEKVDPAIFRDGLHLSPAGYQLYAEQIRPEIRRLLEKNKLDYPELSAVKSPFSIVLAEDAVPMERNAAKELQYFFSLATGKTPEIVSKPVADAPCFILGRSALTRSLLKNVDFEKLGPNEILLERSGKDLVLTGGETQGTLFAVYEFLEKHLGVKFYSSTEIMTPAVADFAFPDVHYRYNPPIRYRAAMYNDIMYTDNVFGLRLRNNGDFLSGMRDWGCHPGYIVWCHSFDRIIPASKYLKDHPEYFSDTGNGTRVGGQTKGQLCLTNPEVKKVFLENLKPILQEKYRPGVRISVSQNDNTHNCHCPACSASDEKYGTSGTIVNFVNSIAEELEKDYPELIVETFAYQYSTTPPKGGVKPRHNVAILLCSIGSNCGASLSSDTNAAFRDELKGWNEITKRISIWCYVTNFENYMNPFPNLEIFAKDMKFLADNHVFSVLAQGDWNGGGVTGDFVAMRLWLFSKLMWNPQLDTDELVREFTDNYYGKAAAPFIREYWKLLSAETVRNKAYVGCFSGGTGKWLSLESLLKAYDLMESAVASVKDADWLTQERALIAAQPIRIAVLERINVIRQKAPDRKIDCKALLYTVELIADRNRGVKYQENRSATALYASLAKKILPQPPHNPAKPSPRTEGRTDCVVLQAQDIGCSPAQFSTIQDDPLSSDGKAIRFEDKIYTWTPQYHPNLDGFPMQPGKYHMYLTLRAEAADGQTGSGIAFECGSYDVVKKIISETNIPFEKISGKYTEIDLGVHNLHQGCYLYWAPKNNPSVKYVFVDRLVIVPEK